MKYPSSSNILYFDTLNSTNTYLLEHHELLKQDRLVVVADQQTKGRGRMNRQFLSLQGQNLTFSLVVHRQLPSDKIGIYSLLAGVAVSQTLEKLYELQADLKWPNDVLIQNAKVCGILIESSNFANALVMGIGINCCGSGEVYSQQFNRPITTIEEHMKKSVQREKLLTALLQDIHQLLEKCHQNSETILSKWLKRTKNLHQMIYVKQHQKHFKGMMIGLTDEGFLKIRLENGEEQRCFSGEIMIDR